MHNRTRRTSDDVLEAHWMKRLRELETTEQFQDAFDGPLSHDLALVKLRRKPDGLGAR